MTLKVLHKSQRRKPDLKDHPQLVGFETLPEKTVWNHFRNSSKEAYSYIYVKFFPILFNYCKQFTQNDALIKDCIQDLFIEMWNKKELLSQTDSIRYYLLSSIRKRVVRSLSKSRRLSNDPYEVDSFNMVLSIEAQIIKDQREKEKAFKIQKAVNDLTFKQREVVFLLFYENLSHEQIANMLSLEKKTVYNLMSKAIQSLRKSL